MSNAQLAQTLRDGPVAVVIINRPPVNAIDSSVRKALIEAIGVLEGDPEVGVIVIACAGKTFFSGADMSEFEPGIAEPGYRKTLACLEQCTKPVVASMHGTVLGGGLELAMACHWRIADHRTKFSMPELTLGLVPGAGGTQRLPRLVGPKAALDMLLSGAPVTAERALADGLIDAVVGADPIAEGIAYAKELLESDRGPRRTSERQLRPEDLTKADIDEKCRLYDKLLRGRTTHTILIETIQAAVQKPFEQGLDIEDRLSQTALKTRESEALRHAFFAERACGKMPDSLGIARPLPVQSVAVIGAGTMGSGIAISFLNGGFDVVLVDAKAEGLERGKGAIHTFYETALSKGRMTASVVESTLSRLKTTIELSEAKAADLIIEAVYEDMALKKDVIGQLDKIVSDQAVIASNTSSLSITEIASATARPDRVVGLHFFSPAHVMRLVEVIRGESSSMVSVATALDVVRRIKKIGVVAGDAFGFIGNKMMLDGYFREAEQLLLEGATPAQVDRVMEAFGFPMGPCRVNDMGGIDIGAAVRTQLFMRESREDPYCVVSDALAKLGRLGQKSGKGFYSYAENPRQGAEDPEVLRIIEQLATDRGIERRVISDAEVEERCVLQLINVGAAILTDGVAYRAGDIDVVWLAGYGFPRHLGGPMFYADTLGLAHVASRIRHYQTQHGHYWEPAALIQELADKKSSFAAYGS